MEKEIICNALSLFNAIWYYQILCFRCEGVFDDPFAPCFQCEDSLARNGMPEYSFRYHDRQAREFFRATAISRRVICRRGPGGRRRCVLRASRKAQLRQVGYGKSIEFVHRENYLSPEDLDLILYYIKLRKYIRRKYKRVLKLWTLMNLWTKNIKQ